MSKRKKSSRGRKTESGRLEGGVIHIECVLGEEQHTHTHTNTVERMTQAESKLVIIG